MQKKRVLDYMERFGSISQKEAFEDLGIMRLSAVIFDLKRDGYEVCKETERGRNRFGEATHFARYSLKDGQRHEG